MDDELLAGLRQIDEAKSTPLHDALDRLGTSGDGLELDAARDQSGNATVSVEATKTIGKGWSVTAAAAWAKGVGYAAMGKLKWTPK